MSAVLLLLAPDRQSPIAIERAVQAAVRTESTLHVAYIIDPAAAERVQRTVGERGFVGEAQCEQLCATIQDEFAERGRDALREVADAARTRGRTSEGIVLVGAFIETALARIRDLEATEVIVARRPGSRLRRLFRGSDLEALQSVAPCPLTIVEAD